MDSMLPRVCLAWVAVLAASTAVAQPGHDLFSSRAQLSGTPLSVAYEPVGTPREPGEPRLDRTAPGHTLWWTWTAPTNGLLRLNAEQFIGIFTGDAVNRLRKVGTGRGQIAVRVQSGVAYQIAVDHSGEGGSHPLDLNFFPRPDNDRIARATVLTGTDVAVTGDNRGFQRSAGNPRVVAGAAGSALWYVWTAPADGHVVVSRTWSDFSLAFGAFRREPSGKLTRLTDSTSSEDSGFVELRFDVQAGRTYVLGVDGARLPEETPMGRFDLRWVFSTLRLISPPLGSLPLDSDVISFRISEPNPQVDGTLMGLEYRQLFPDGGAISLGQADTAPFTLSRSNLASGLYVVAAVGTNAAGQLRWSAPAVFLVRPANDDFARAQLMTGYRWSVERFADGATAERGEPSGKTPSLWYSWKAPAAGPVVLRFDPGNEDQKLQAYTGPALTRLQAQPLVRTNGILFTFTAEAGQTYWFRVGDRPGPLNDEGSRWFHLALDLQSTRLVGIAEGAEFKEPLNLPLGVSTFEDTNAILRVDYLAGTNVIASSAGFPYAAIWSNAVPGFHTLTARVVKSTGDSPVSPGVQIVVRPRNDAFADRLALTGWDADIFQVTRAGRREPGEPDHLFLHRQVSVWWTWTAPLDGELILSIPNFDPQGVALAVYSGGVLTNLQLVAWNTAPSGPSFYRLLPEIRLAVSAGHAYQIAAVEETGSDLALELHFRPPPPNDAFAARPEVAGTNATLEGWTILASSEPQEPAATGASVWWKWQAPGNGILRLRAWMRPDDLRGLVWTGNSLTTIQPVLLLPPPPLPVSTNPAAAAVVVLASRHVPPRQPPPPAVPAWTNFVVCNVSAGTEYAISIQDTLGGLIDFSVLLDFTPAPANDDYEQRVAWVEVPGPFELENDGAGVQAGEAEHGAHSVWFNWVAPTTGVLTILETNGLSGLLAVPYEGNGLANLIPAPVAPGTGGYKVYGGRAYAVAVTAPPGMLGTWPCQLDLRPSPPNDDFANRALLTGTNVQVEFEALGASIEPGEPDPSLAGAFQSLWWTWTAPASGIANLILVGASPGYSARVFEGDSLGSLQPAGLQPTGDGGWFRAQAGRTYQLELLVWAIPSNPGPFTFSLLMPPSPSNDDFANSATLVGTNWAVNASNLGATPEPQETRDHFNSRTIWYTWQAPASGWAYLWTSSNSSPIQYFAYVGSTLAGLRTAPGFAQYGMSPTIFEAREGETYHISADGSEGRAGVLAFRLEFVPGPANDDFAGRQALGSGPASLAGTYVGATREPGEPRHTPATWWAPTIWWSWTADRSGPVVLTNFSYGLSLVVYRGTTLSSLSRVTGNDRSDGFIFDASAGESYAIAADGSYGMPAVVSASLVLPGQAAAAAVPRSVRLSGVRPGPAGGAVVVVEGAPGTAFVLEASEDLRSWVGVQAHTLRGPRVELADDGVANRDQRFYRVRWAGPLR